MADITKIIVDNEQLVDFEKVIEREDEVLIAVDELENGDKVTLVYDEVEEDYNEAIFLSVDNENVYKDLAIEVEIEFIKQAIEYEKNFEIIARAVSNRNKTYSVDEYYVFGLQDSYFYFAKTDYHEEGTDSYPYKILFNLRNDANDVAKYFQELTTEQQEKLFLDKDVKELRYEDKYVFRCEIKNGLASLRIRNTSKVESMETKHPWVIIFEGVRLAQNLDEISVRNDKMDVIVNLSEPFRVIDGKGLYGFAIPNSYLRIHRFEVIPFDDDISINYYDDESYSKEVSTNFSRFYRTEKDLKFSSSDSKNELKDSYKEFEKVEGDSVELEGNIITEDIIKIQMNEVEQHRDVNYEDKFVDVKIHMGKEHESSVLKAFVDDDLVDNYGQREEYFDVEDITDGIIEEYSVSDDFLTKVKYYPNAKVGDLLVEVEEDYILNSFKKVGIQKNVNKFFTEDKIESEFGGTSFFMETNFRGDRKFFEMGPIGNGRYLFGVDDYFYSANASYEAVWKYNLANFIDDICVNYRAIDTITDGDVVVDSEFDASGSLPLVSVELSGSYNVTLGYAFAELPYEELDLLSNKTTEEVLPNFSVLDTELESDVKRLLEEGYTEDSIRILLAFFQNLNFPDFATLFLNAAKKDESFTSISVSISGDYGQAPSDVFNPYANFREVWLRDWDYNSHVTTNSIQKRKFYTSYSKDKYNIDIEKGVIKFIVKPDVGRKMVLRIFYDNIVELTNNYTLNDEFYFVPEGIKKLHEITNAEKGIVDVMEFLNPAKYNIILQNDIPFVVVPKSLNENDGQLYADIEVCSPFVETNDNVKRLVRAPLKKVSVFLENDFESSIEDDVYEYTTSASILAMSGTTTWNRDKDFYDFDVEFKTNVLGGANPRYYNYAFPKSYPIPDGTVNSDYFSDDGFVIENEYINNLLAGSVVTNDIIDQYLDVSSWFNVNYSKLGPYYRKVLKAIIDVKSYNRYYTERIIVDESRNALILGNWLDGFYCGTRTSWSEISPHPSLDFGKYFGNPWGTQNSRKQMIDQIRNTITGKFPKHELYFVDLTNLTEYQRYVLDGVDASYVNTSTYPEITSKEFFIDNPYIDPRIKDYVFNQEVIDDNGVTIFDPDSFVSFSDNYEEYPTETVQAYGDIKKINFDIRNIVRQITNGIDMYWGFDTGILFSSRQKNILPAGTEVNAEYEYSKKDVPSEANFPYRVVQKVNLGRATGKDFQKFSNPNVINSNTVERCNVHRVWLDNYIVKNYDVLINGDNSKIVLSYPDNYKTTKDISVLYKASNYFNLDVVNMFKDTFITTGRRDFMWMFLTRDDKGYLKKFSHFAGYVTDSTKITAENVFHLDDIDGDRIKTSGIGFSTDVIRPIQVGREEEDIIAISSLRRNNNFEIVTDIYYDTDIDREFMKTDVIFRGKFNIVNGRQYFNEFYSITLGLADSSISLISRTYDSEGIKDEQLLANVQDSLNTIKRGQFYTLKIRVINDDVRVFFNERNQEELFYFSFNLRNGHNKTNEEAVAEKKLDGLNVFYEEPRYYINGNRIGIRTLHQGVNFSNFIINALEEGNNNLENGLVVNNFDSVISQLKKIHSIEGSFRKFKRTNDGYDFLQIGGYLFYKRTDGVYAMHHMSTEDFDVIEDKVYVREKILTTSNFIVVNVYEKDMKLVNNILVDSKDFVNEPIYAYLSDTNRVVSNIEEIDGRLFITTADSCGFAKTWLNMGDCVWTDNEAIWNLYG